MIKITGGTTEPGGGREIIVTGAGAPQPSSGDWLQDQYEALEKKFDSRLREVRGRLTEAWELDEGGVSIDLNTELDRELWLRILYHAFLDVYPGAELEFPGELKGRGDFWLEWQLSKDGETLMAELYSGDDHIGEADWDWFISEAYWESIGLRWLIHQLGATPDDIKTALRAMPRK